MTRPLISSGRKSKFYPTVSERMAGCQKVGKQIFSGYGRGDHDIGTVDIFLKKIIAVIIISLVFCFVLIYE